jgi:DNA-binding response OmpR family regulator
MQIARNGRLARVVLTEPPMAMPSSLPESTHRRVLLVIEDRALSDVLAEALVDAGHVATQVEDAASAQRALEEQRFDAAIVDLDTRARDGGSLIAHLRTEQPALTVIALLPCGGLSPSVRQPLYHLAIEKPARLAAVLSAVNVAHAVMRN